MTTILHPAIQNPSHQTTTTTRQQQQSILAITPTKTTTTTSHLLHILHHYLTTLSNLLRLLLRTATITLHLSPLLLLLPLSPLSPPVVERLAWRYALHAIQNLGPAFVKLAQWAATRPDLFSSRLCRSLGSLCDDAAVHGWNETKRCLIAAFGEDYEERGLVLDESEEGGGGVIIGSGSVAQVYRGTLDGVGPVAVKVLHPRIRERVERDLLLMTTAAWFLDEVVLPRDVGVCLSLPRAVDNFVAVLRKQVDLRVEGENLKRFCENFEGWETGKGEGTSCEVGFPRVVDGWLTEEVLVETLVEDSMPISRYLEGNTIGGDNTTLEKQGHELALPLLRAFLKMIFLDNFVHADLHPGNVLVKHNNNSHNDNKYSIVFLDAGIAVSLSPSDRQNLKDLFRAVVTNDGDTVGRLMVQRAKYERCSQTPGGVDAFACGMEAIVSEFHDRRRQGLTLGAVKIGSLLGRVLDLCRVHGVEVDPAMASVVVSTLVLEGLGRSLDPDVNLMNCALPFILRS